MSGPYYYRSLEMSGGFGIYGPDGWVYSVEDEDEADLLADALNKAYQNGRRDAY